MVKVSSTDMLDAGLATQYKPVAVGNRADGLGQTLNENIEMVRKLSLRCNSDPDDYEGVMCNCWIEIALPLSHGRRDVLSCFLVLNTEF